MNCNAGEMSEVPALGTSTSRTTVHYIPTSQRLTLDLLVLPCPESMGAPSQLRLSHSEWWKMCRIQPLSEKGEYASNEERFRKMGTS